MATPDWNGWLASVWGGGSVESGLPESAVIAAASNVVVGQNPPYTLQNFFTMYPKFGGTPLLSGTAAPSASLTAGSRDLTVDNAAGMAVGQPLAGAGVPDGTFIAAVDVNAKKVTMTNPATQTLANSPLLVWNATPVPPVVLQLYIALASSHLVQARWLDTWVIAMGLFVAHFATLYARSDGNVGSSAGQIASQGLAFGVQVAKSVGDVSVNYTPIEGLENWGAWNLTSYGQQLATFAKVIGIGPMMLY